MLKQTFAIIHNEKIGSWLQQCHGRDHIEQYKSKMARNGVRFPAIYNYAFRSFQASAFQYEGQIFDAQMYWHLITQIMKNAKKRLDNLCFFDPKLVFFWPNIVLISYWPVNYRNNQEKASATALVPLVSPHYTRKAGSLASSSSAIFYPTICQ